MHHDIMLKFCYNLVVIMWVWVVWGCSCRADVEICIKAHICMRRCFDVHTQVASTGPKASVNLQIEYKSSKAHTWVCVHLLKQSTAVRACLCLVGACVDQWPWCVDEQHKWERANEMRCVLFTAAGELETQRDKTTDHWTHPQNKRERERDTSL